MHSYWFETGVYEQLRQWKIEENGQSECKRETGNGEWILLVIRITRMAVGPSSGLPFLAPADEVHVVFEDDREEPLDDWWTMITGNTPIRKSQLQPRYYGNMILPLSDSSSPFWILLVENSAIKSAKARSCSTPFFIASSNICGLNGVSEAPMNQYPHLTINLVDFATLSLRDQVTLVQSTDVLIGHHGAGMTHVLFLPEESAVIEILPPIFRTAGFRQLSKMLGLTYFSTHSIWVRDWEKEMNSTSGLAAGPAPTDEAGWQEEEWAYIKEDEFQGLVDAALRSQHNRALPGGI